MKWSIELFGGTETPLAWNRPVTISMKLRDGRNVAVRNAFASRTKARLCCEGFLRQHDNIGVRLVLHPEVPK